MNIRNTILLTFVFLACLVRSPAQDSGLGLSLGARYHTDHSVYTDLPFKSGNISYMAALEYGERYALWQLGLGFAPDVTGTRDDHPDEALTKHVLTPQLNLIFKDRFFRAGTGVLKSYIKDDDGGSEWTKFYWQVMTGLSFDLTKSLSLDGGVHYVMKRWDRITKFRFNDLDYTLLLSFRF